MSISTHSNFAVVDIQFTGLNKFRKGEILKIQTDQDIFEYYVLVANPNDVVGVSVTDAIDNGQLLKIKYGTTIEGENGKFLYKINGDKAVTSPYLQHNPQGTNSALNIDTTVDNNGVTPLRIFTHSEKIIQAYTSQVQFAVNQYGVIGAGISIDGNTNNYNLYCGRSNAIKARDGFGWDFNRSMDNRFNYVTGYPATGQGTPEDGYYWIDYENQNLAIYNSNGHFGWFKGKTSLVGNKEIKYSGFVLWSDSWVYLPANSHDVVYQKIEDWKNDINEYPKGGQLIYDNSAEEIIVRRKGNSNEWKALAVKTNDYVNYDVVISQNDNYNASSTLGKSLKYNWTTGTLGLGVDVTSSNINVYDVVAGDSGTYLAYKDTTSADNWVGYNFGLGTAYPAQARIDWYNNSNNKKHLHIRATSSKYTSIDNATRMEVDCDEDSIKFYNLPNGLKLINNDGEANDTRRAMMFINFIANDDNAVALLEPLDKPTFVLGGIKENDNSSFVVYWADGNGNVYKDELWGYQIN